MLGCCVMFFSPGHVDRCCFPICSSLQQIQDERICFTRGGLKNCSDVINDIGAKGIFGLHFTAISTLDLSDFTNSPALSIWKVTCSKINFFHTKDSPKLLDISFIASLDSNHLLICTWMTKYKPENKH